MSENQEVGIFGHSDETEEMITNRNKYQLRQMEGELVARGVRIFKGDVEVDLVHMWLGPYDGESGSWVPCDVVKRTAKTVVADVHGARVRLDRSKLEVDGSVWCKRVCARIYSSAGRAARQREDREIYLRNVPAWGHA
jgi:hypothetical protein